MVLLPQRSADPVLSTYVRMAQLVTNWSSRPSHPLCNVEFMSENSTTNDDQAQRVVEELFTQLDLLVGTILGQDQFGRRDYEYEHGVLREASEIHKSLATLAPNEMVQALVDVALARRLRALVGGREPVDVQYRSHANSDEIAVSDRELLNLLRYVGRSNSAE